MSDAKTEQNFIKLGRIFQAISGLQSAVGDQKPELIALYMGKVLNEFSRLDKDFVDEVVNLMKSKLK